MVHQYNEIPFGNKKELLTHTPKMDEWMNHQNIKVTQKKPDIKRILYDFIHKKILREINLVYDGREENLGDERKALYLDCERAHLSKLIKLCCKMDVFYLYVHYTSTKLNFKSSHALIQDAKIQKLTQKVKVLSATSDLG